MYQVGEYSRLYGERQRSSLAGDATNLNFEAVKHAGDWDGAFLEMNESLKGSLNLASAPSVPDFHLPDFQVPAVQMPFQAPAFQAPAVQIPFQGPAFQVPALQGPVFQIPALQAPAFHVPTFQTPTVTTCCAAR